jgi:hypothetical protein
MFYRQSNSAGAGAEARHSGGLACAEGRGRPSDSCGNPKVPRNGHSYAGFSLRLRLKGTRIERPI